MVTIRKYHACFFSIIEILTHDEESWEEKDVRAPVLCWTKGMMQSQRGDTTWGDWFIGGELCNSRIRRGGKIKSIYLNTSKIIFTCTHPWEMAQLKYFGEGNGGQVCAWWIAGKASTVVTRKGSSQACWQTGDVGTMHLQFNFNRLLSS